MVFVYIAYKSHNMEDLWSLTINPPNINLSQYCDYDARNKKKLGPICQIIEVINVHKWWNPH